MVNAFRVMLILSCLHGDYVLLLCYASCAQIVWSKLAPYVHYLQTNSMGTFISLSGFT